MSGCLQAVPRRALFGVVTLALVPVPAWAESCGGISYPGQKAVLGKKLLLNGVGIREATVFNVDVYVAGLYVEKKSSNGAQLARSEQVKQMVLTLVRDVEAEEMNEAIEDGFKKNAGERFSALRPRIDQFKKAIPNLDEGDVIDFTYAPKRGLAIRVNGKHRGQVPGADFTTVFFNIWLGPHPPNAGLKRGLLGGKCD